MRYAPTKHQNTGSHRPSVAHTQIPVFFPWLHPSILLIKLLFVSYDAITAVSSITVMGIWGIYGFGARRIGTNLMTAPHELTMRTAAWCRGQCCFGSDLVGWLARCRGVVDCVSGWCRAE
uniref:Uncharacterized protein n=1 Tax=Triticum urartu TaxID=4572 RepID=A0A8R7Q6C1_TRIUA